MPDSLKVESYAPLAIESTESHGMNTPSDAFVGVSTDSEAGTVTRPDSSTHASVMNERSATDKAQATTTEHAKDFNGTTEQARELCPYLGRLSYDKASEVIRTQAKKEATLDSFMDTFEAKQKSKVVEKSDEVPRRMTATETSKAIANSLAEKSQDVVVSAENESDKRLAIKHETRRTEKLEILTDTHRDTLRRLAVEKISALHQRVHEATADSEVISSAVTTASTTSPKLHRIIQPVAVPGLKTNAVEALAVPFVAVNEMIQKSQTVNVAVKTEIMTPVVEPVVILSPTFEPVLSRVEQAEIKTVPEDDALFSEHYSEERVLEITENALEVNEGFEQPPVESILLPSVDEDHDISEASDAMLTLENEDAEKISPLLLVHNEFAEERAAALLKTEYVTDQSETEVDVQVAEIVHQAEARHIVAELVDRVMQLQSEISLIQAEASGRMAGKIGEHDVVTPVVAEAKTEALVAKIEQLLEQLVVLSELNGVHDLVDELLDNPELELLFEHLEAEENRLKYLSERLGTSEFLGRAHHTKGLLQRTVGYLHRIIGTSTLNLYGIHTDRIIVSR